MCNSASDRHRGEENTSEDTSIQLRRVKDGDQASLARIVSRFSPLVLAQASYRLGRSLRKHYDPEDLVADVWSVALPRLMSGEPGNCFTTQGLLRFLSTTLIYRVRNLLRKHYRDEPIQRPGELDGEKMDLFASIAADITGVITRAVKSEQRGEILGALDQLDPVDRQVIILRGIEQNSNEVVATILALKPNTVSQRYKRALNKLRDRLRNSVFSELSAE